MVDFIMLYLLPFSPVILDVPTRTKLFLGAIVYWMLYIAVANGIGANLWCPADQPY